jgi:hypothetical protein
MREHQSYFFFVQVVCSAMNYSPNLKEMHLPKIFIIMLGLWLADHFSIKLLFSGRTREATSPSTDQVSPRLHLRPHAYIAIEQRQRKNGEKHSCLRDFTFIVLSIFSN